VRWKSQALGRALISLLLSTPFAGCTAEPLNLWPFTQKKAEPPPEQAAFDDNPFAVPQPTEAQAAMGVDVLRVVRLTFDVVRADLPLGGVRDVPKIWNHVDQLRVQDAGGALLVRNGIRMGVASPDAWPVIRAILDRPGIDVRRDQLVPPAGQPLAIHLNMLEDARPVFYYGADNRLTGKTFPAGDKLLDIEYNYRPEIGEVVDLRTTLEIRRDLGVMRWERREGVVREVPAYDRHLFDSLSSLITLKPDEFLVVGLSEKVDQASLIGNEFFTFEQAGRRYETILFITPKTRSTQIPRSARRN
jgi:hypothetical protein